MPVPDIVKILRSKRTDHISRVPLIVNSQSENAVDLLVNKVLTKGDTETSGMARGGRVGLKLGISYQSAHLSVHDIFFLFARLNLLNVLICTCI